jgi:hypothetical protein
VLLRACALSDIMRGFRWAGPALLGEIDGYV